MTAYMRFSRLTTAKLLSRFSELMGKRLSSLSKEDRTQIFQISMEVEAREEIQKVTQVLPRIVVLNDVGGYFESLVRSWYDLQHVSKLRPRRKVVLIDSGPYRTTEISYLASEDGTILSLDFHSTIQEGLGGVSSQDVDWIVSNIL